MPHVERRRNDLDPTKSHLREVRSVRERGRGGRREQARRGSPFERLREEGATLSATAHALRKPSRPSLTY
ncbi:hypothetical protein [Deinococcus yavapaiensis]|uniref:hypothetical protein n=1 Tax=Deinococcus yavapaiensis TaxID=309889 RepID=UPI000DA158AB|nr:hypothetical protein [Deinococcus yavapaiensis]